MRRGTSSSTSIISITPAPPGPPDRYIRWWSRRRLNETRAIRSGTVPGVAPLWSSGTRSVAQRTPSASGQPRQRSFASAGEASVSRASTAIVIAARTIIRERL
jgi:hypothetical protein